MISIGANILLWHLKSIDNKNPESKELKSLKKKTNSLMKILQSLLLASNAIILSEVSIYYSHCYWLLTLSFYLRLVYTTVTATRV